MPFRITGDSWLPIILVVIIGAFYLSGASIKRDALLIPTPTPDPATALTPAALSPTATPVPWNIVVDSVTCSSNPARGLGKITATGPSEGYVLIELANAAGTFVSRGASKFSPPSQIYNINLPSSAGYNAREWKVKVFSGGSVTIGSAPGIDLSENWAGGQEQDFELRQQTTCN